MKKSKMNTNQLRDYAVSLGAERNELYGTSRQALILTIDKLEKNKDEATDMKVKNSNETMIWYNLAVEHMDDKIREELHEELAPCSEQEFFTAYAKKHYEKFGETWFLDEKNPAY